jgi:hypothetical protein
MPLERRVGPHESGQAVQLVIEFRFRHGQPLEVPPPGWLALAAVQCHQGRDDGLDRTALTLCGLEQALAQKTPRRHRLRAYGVFNVADYIGNTRPGLHLPQPHRECRSRDTVVAVVVADGVQQTRLVPVHAVWVFAPGLIIHDGIVARCDTGGASLAVEMLDVLHRIAGLTNAQTMAHHGIEVDEHPVT